MKKIFPVLLLSFFMFPTVSSFASEFGLRGYYWFPSISGSVRVDFTDTLGTSADLENDLGIEDEGYPIVEGFIGLGNHHLSLAYTNVDHSGTGVLSTNITFNGRVFPVNATVSSSLKYSWLDLNYQYDLLDFENFLAGGSLGLVINLKYFDGEVGMVTTGIDEKEDFRFPIPMAGLNLHVGILADIIEARARITAVSYSDNTVYDFLAEVSYTPFPFLDINGGYRTFSVDVDEDDGAFNFDLTGPYVALTLSF